MLEDDIKSSSVSNVNVLSHSQGQQLSTSAWHQTCVSGKFSFLDWVKPRGRADVSVGASFGLNTRAGCKSSHGLPDGSAKGLAPCFKLAIGPRGQLRLLLEKHFMNAINTDDSLGQEEMWGLAYRLSGWPVGPKKRIYYQMASSNLGVQELQLTFFKTCIIRRWTPGFNW